MNDPIRIAVSGAAGQIGYALIFRIAAGGLFGPGRRVALSLLDVPSAMPLLDCHRMELFDCAFPLLADLKIGDDPVEAFAGADWIILLASYSPGPGPIDRLAMLRKNGPIYVEHGQAINVAAPNARILVVANPCNTNCLIAKSHARNVPEDHWFAMTRLDRMRATAMIAEKAGVPVGEVTRVTAWGNHSEQVYVDFHNAYIGERPAFEVIRDPAWARDVLEPTVAHRGSELFRLRGSTPAASAAQAVIGMIRSITTPTPHNRRFGAAVVSDGHYAVPRGLIFGLPLRTHDGVSWSIVHGLYLDDHAQARIAANVAELEHEAAVVTDLIGRVEVT